MIFKSISPSAVASLEDGTNDPWSLIFRPLCSPHHQCIKVGLHTSRIWWKLWCVTPEGRSMKDIAISALLAWITCSGGSQLLYHEDTQTLCIDPHDKNLRPVANSTDLTAVCTVLEADHPAPVGHSGDDSPDQHSKLRHSSIPHSRKLK